MLVFIAFIVTRAAVATYFSYEFDQKSKYVGYLDDEKGAYQLFNDTTDVCL